jgi:hypothetical protein
MQLLSVGIYLQIPEFTEKDMPWFKRVAQTA